MYIIILSTSGKGSCAPAGALFEACRGAVVVDGGVVAVVVEEYILDGGDGIIALGSMMTGGVAAPDILVVENKVIV